MKCPKCNYTSFDYNQTCPKCGNNNGEEQARLKFSPNKPNPPFFLASLLGMVDSDNPSMRGGAGRMTSSESVYGEMEAQDLLIALDDLDMDDARPDFPEATDHLRDEIVFETDDSREEPMAQLEPAEDEILFDLEPASDENEIEVIDRDPLDKRGFLDRSSDKDPVVVEVPETRPEKKPTSETADQAHEIDLFLADETESPEIATEDTGSAAFSPAREETDSPELFLSLNDLPDDDAKPKPSSSGPTEVHEILFELEESSGESSDTAEKKVAGKKGFWDSEAINDQLAVFDLEDIDGKKTAPSPKGKDAVAEEVNLFSDLDIEPLDLELSLEDIEKT